VRTSPKTFVTASPDDLIRFLIWKDKSGKTRVHRDSCPFFGSSAKRTACPCPTRLAAGTVDNYVAKLKALYSSLGSTTTSNSSSLSFSNPASHPSVAKYLTSIREEQAQVPPRQAIPLFFDKFLALCSFIKTSLAAHNISPTTRYLYARDLAFFSLDFFSGDCASDLGRLKTNDVFRLPDNDGLLFRHAFGKTLRGQHTHMFAVKPSPHSTTCPIADLGLYVLLSDRMGINLHNGYLFRTTDHRGCIVDALFLSSAASNRLKKYLGQLKLDEGETVHSFRAGCSITLSLLGASDEVVAAHVGWRSLATARYYIGTDTMTNPPKTSDLLVDYSSTSATPTAPSLDNLGASFHSSHNRNAFSLAFPPHVSP
jgi:integrase